MSDDLSPSVRDPNTRGSKKRAGMSLGDQFQLAGVVVGVISLAVAIFFGYRSLNPPAPPPTATPTSGPTPTPVASGTVFFEDDFESGLARWRTNAAWEIREDAVGNHILCATPKQGFSWVNPRNTGVWSNYVFSAKVMTLEDLKQQGAFTFDVLYRIDPEVQSFQFQITELRTSLFRFDPDSRKWHLLTDTETELVKPDTWYSVLIQVEPDGTLRYSVDGIQLIKYLDPESFIPDGIIRMGASPNSDVCFDDVKISVP